MVFEEKLRSSQRGKIHSILYTIHVYFQHILEMNVNNNPINPNDSLTALMAV